MGGLEMKRQGITYNPISPNFAITSCLCLTVFCHNFSLLAIVDFKLSPTSVSEIPVEMEDSPSSVP